MLIKQSEATAARRTVVLGPFANTSDDSAYTSALSGADLKISKAGGAFANSTGTATHLEAGYFAYVLTASECDTLGELVIRCAKTGVYPDAKAVQVVAFDPCAATNLGLTNLDTTVGSRLPTASYAAPSTLLTSTDGVETGLTLQAAIRLVLAGVAGRRMGIGSDTEVYRDFGNTKARITMTLDSGGNTTAVTYDAA